MFTKLKNIISNNLHQSFDLSKIQLFTFRNISRRRFLVIVFTNAILPIVSLRLSSVAKADQAPLLGSKSDSETVRNHLKVLNKFGSFFYHSEYGQVWKPDSHIITTNWFPYCDPFWIWNKNLGWYYYDPTPWGEIIHHYGRWKNDHTGWFWVPGREFSPAWVIWRINQKFIGWMHMPPDKDLFNDIYQISNNMIDWHFFDINIFGNYKIYTEVATQKSSNLLSNTKYVTDHRLVGGIVIFNLPTYSNPAHQDINVCYDPWSIHFFRSIFVFWNKIFESNPH